MNVFQMASGKHPLVAEVIHSQDNPQPSVICYTNKQISDFKTFVSSKEGVTGRFHSGSVSLPRRFTNQAKSYEKGTGEPPIMLGPNAALGRQTTKKISHIRGILGLNLKSTKLIMGTDDKRVMTNAINMAFQGCKKKIAQKIL